jgi:hypothetical protein
VVEKNEVVFQGGLKIHSFNSGETFFKNFKIWDFKARLNDQVFSVQGEIFSKKLIAAIRKAKPGDQLIFSSVRAKNFEEDRTINLGNTTYELR